MGGVRKGRVSTPVTLAGGCKWTRGAGEDRTDPGSRKKTSNKEVWGTGESFPVPSNVGPMGSGRLDGTPERPRRLSRPGSVGVTHLNLFHVGERPGVKGKPVIFPAGVSRHLR